MEGFVHGQLGQRSVVASQKITQSSSHKDFCSLRGLAVGLFFHGMQHKNCSVFRKYGEKNAEIDSAKRPAFVLEFEVMLDWLHPLGNGPTRIVFSRQSPEGVHDMGILRFIQKSHRSFASGCEVVNRPQKLVWRFSSCPKADLQRLRHPGGLLAPPTTNVLKEPYTTLPGNMQRGRCISSKNSGILRISAGLQRFGRGATAGRTLRQYGRGRPAAAGMPPLKPAGSRFAAGRRLFH